MDTNKRPDDMQRIVAPEQARAFIDEQVEAVRAQVGDARCFWRSPAAWTRRWWRRS